MKLAHDRAPQGWGPNAASRKPAVDHPGTNGAVNGTSNGTASALAESKDELVEQKVFAKIEDVIPREELEEVGKRYKAVAGFEVDAVNKRAKETEGLAEKRGLKSPAKWCGEQVEA